MWRGIGMGVGVGGGQSDVVVVVVVLLHLLFAFGHLTWGHFFFFYASLYILLLYPMDQADRQTGRQRARGWSLGCCCCCFLHSTGARRGVGRKGRGKGGGWVEVGSQSRPTPWCGSLDGQISRVFFLFPSPVQAGF